MKPSIMLTVIRPIFAMLFVIVPTLLIVAPADRVLVLFAVPVPFLLPSTPVLFHIIMCDPVMSGTHVAVSVRHAGQCTRFAPGSH